MELQEKAHSCECANMSGKKFIMLRQYCLEK